MPKNSLSNEIPSKTDCEFSEVCRDTVNIIF